MKGLSKKLTLVCCVCFCTMAIFMTNNLPVYASEEAGIASEDDDRSTNMTWYYKEIDGVLYMRLFNHATGEWVTDWIPAVG